MRIFAVTGTSIPTAFATPEATLASSGQSRSSEEPPLRETTLFTGQPKLMSMKSGTRPAKPLSMIFRAASPIRSPSAPKSCTPTGRCPSSNSVYFRVRSSACMIPSALTNSVTITSAPISLQILRKIKSVTPAIGARYKGNFPEENQWSTAQSSMWVKHFLLQVRVSSITHTAP